MRTKRREVYQGQDLLLPELRMLGTDAPRTADQRSLSLHAHRGAWELCYIAGGEVAWWAGQEVHEVGPGHVYLIRPDEPHGGVDAVLHPCELYWLQLRVGRSLPGMTRGHGEVLIHQLADLKLRCFPGSRAVQEGFEQLLAEHRRRDALSSLSARATLHALLTHVLRDHEAQVAAESQRHQRISPAIHSALARLEQDPAAPVSELAGHAGLGVSRFHERFRFETGLTPVDWRNRQRIRRAKDLLRGGHAVTAIAMALDFSSSQYFATAFKRHVGLTPGQYRQRFHSGGEGT